jgi:hypothetical protein
MSSMRFQMSRSRSCENDGGKLSDLDVPTRVGLSKSQIATPS